MTFTLLAKLLSGVIINMKDNKSMRLSLRLSDREDQMLKSGAKSQNMSTSTYVRYKLFEESKRMLGDLYPWSETAIYWSDSESAVNRYSEWGDNTVLSVG